jgi:hypothetical protein
MLEVVRTDLVFTISLKRSAQNLQLSTSWPADYPIFRGESGHRKYEPPRSFLTRNGSRAPPTLVVGGADGFLVVGKSDRGHT